MNYQLRLAKDADGPAIESLISQSARHLGGEDYNPEQIEEALKGVFGLDTQLIVDRTYFVVEMDGELVGCGGWSFRKTLFGGDSGAARDPESLDPAVDAAKVRAFFIHPEHARRGLGTLVLDHCELAAQERGFKRVELMATLTGLKLYAARGYKPADPVDYEMASGLSLTIVPMEKQLAGAKV